MTAAPIAVVIPCRNAAPWIAEAIASVRAQSRPAVELVVVDDASEDGSAAIAAQAGARVVGTPSARGNAAARNAGIAATTAPLVAFLDADDIWLPDHLAVLGDRLDRHAEAVAAFGACEVFGDTTGVHRGFLPDDVPEDAFLRCLRWWVGQPSACIVRRTALERVGGFDASYVAAVDFDAWLRLSAIGPLVASHRITARYRRHATQLSRQGDLQERGKWRARVEAVGRLAANEDPRRATAQAVVEEHWADEARTAWDAGRLDQLALLVELAPPWQALAGRVRRWRWRLRLPPTMVRWWFASPLRPLWHRARGAR